MLKNKQINRFIKARQIPLHFKYTKNIQYTSNFMLKQTINSHKHDLAQSSPKKTFAIGQETNMQWHHKYLGPKGSNIIIL